jgi:hypothetical protein
VDPEVAAVMSIPPYTSIVASGHRSRPTDLDRYVRSEFGDCETRWLADGVHSDHPAHTDDGPGESDNDGRLLRRLTQAIASFF